MKTDEQALQGYLSDSFNHKQELINLADVKANILLGLIGVILALFFRFIVDTTSTSILFLLILFVLIPFVISGLLALSVIYPRTSKIKQETPIGLGKADSKIYVDQILELSMQQIAKDYDEATTALTAVANRKFRYLRFAYLFFVIGVGAKIVIELMLII